MQSPSKSTNQQQNPNIHTINHVDQPLDFFQRSELQHNLRFSEDFFQGSKEKTLGLFNLDCEIERRDYFMIFKEHNNNQETAQDYLNSLLSFRRGFSQRQELGNERNYDKPKQYGFLASQAMRVQEADNRLYVMTTQEDQSVKSALADNEQKLTKDRNQEVKQKLEEKKISTKNVTKNMGKLLFKWIWSNRHNIQAKLKDQFSEWDYFIEQVKQWKKENNITRKFLSERWHSTGTTSKLFRMVSAHFFRERCLGAICQSNIQEKQMHIKRIHRFLEGVSNSAALDSLN